MGGAERATEVDARRAIAHGAGTAAAIAAQMAARPSLEFQAVTDETVRAGGSRVTATPTWFGNPERPLSGWWHLPAGPAAGGVVLCPPIGRDYVNAHRCYRALAAELSEAGLAVLRFDLAGTGDSADGPAGSEVSDWLDSTIEAVSAMRDAGAARVALVGMRVGVDLVLGAVSRGADVEAAVLWDPCTTLTGWLREQHALIRLAVPGRRPVPDGVTETAGYAYPASVKAAFSGLQSEETAWPESTPVLGLLREEGPPPGRLSSRLAATGQWAVVAGQDELLGVPEYDAVVPTVTMALVTSWIRGVLAREGEPLAVAPAISPTATVTTGGPAGPVTETVLQLGPDRLFGILTEPGRSGGPTMVLLNNGAEHHAGPSRLWIELSRGWADLGLRTLRLDLSGIGDSPPRPGWEPGVVFAPHGVDDVVEAVRALQPDTPADVVFGGLCSGAFTAERAAIELGARGIALLNPNPWGQTVAPLGVAVGQDEHGATSYSAAAPPLKARARAAVKKYGKHPALRSIRESSPQLVWAALDRAKVRTSPAAGFKTLVGGRTQVVLVFGDEDFAPYRRQVSRLLAKLASTGHLRLERIPDLDHAILAEVPRREAVELLTKTVAEWWAPRPDRLR